MIWREPTHWPTHPPNHPPIHLSKGGSVSTNHKSSNRIELSRLDQVLLKFLWFHMFWPTNPPIHPTTHQKKHPPMGGEFSTVFTDLGVTLLGGGWVGGGVGLGGGTPPRTCICAYACMHAHAHAHAHTHAYMLNMINMAASMVAAICNFLTCLS